MARHIIIVWKWTIKTGIQIDPFENNESESVEPVEKEFSKYFDRISDHANPKNQIIGSRFEIPVEKQQNRIIGYTKADGLKYDISELQKECDRLTNRGNEILILLHTGYPDHFNQIPAELETESEKVKICLFGGGKEKIYETLINETGQFKEEAIKIDDFGNWIGINSKNFDCIWNYYWWKDCKKKVYELKEDILIQMYPLRFDQKDKKTTAIMNIKVDGVKLIDRIRNFRQYDGEKNSEKTIKNSFQFNDFWKDFESTERKVIYERLKKELKSLIDKREYNDEVINSVRSNFNQLLLTIPTEIY